MKRMPLLLAGIIFAIFLIGNVQAYSQTFYSFEMGSGTTVEAKRFISVIPQNGTCSATASLFYDLVSSGGTWSYQFEIIENGTTLLTTSPITTSGNKNCETALTGVVIPKGILNVTGRATSLATNMNVTVYLEVALNCTTFNNSIIVMNGTNPNITLRTEQYNSYGYESQISIDGQANSSNVGNIWNAHKPAHCQAQFNNLEATVPPNNPTNGTWSIMSQKLYTGFGGTCNILFGFGNQYCNGYTNWAGSAALGYIPISAYSFERFNSGIGIVNFNIDPIVDGGVTGVAAGIMDESGGFIYNFTPGLPYTNINISLIPNQNYVLWLAQVRATGAAFVGLPVINITFTDYQPNIVCTAWSNCTNHVQSRICNDTNNIVPPQYQTRSCLFVNETIYLGFEQSAPRITTECMVGTNPNPLFACFFFPTNIQYKNPENPHWDILPNSIILFPPNQTQGSVFGGQMVSTESFTVNGSTIIISPINQSWNRGSNFLKLWYQPPFFTHAVFDINSSSFTCANSTGGLISEANFEFLNDSFFASLNFTFPSETMKMFVDVRKCPSTPIQYTPPSFCLFSGGQQCYGSCTEEPKGNFFITVFDATTSQVVLRYDDVSLKESWSTYQLDVSNTINQTHDYRLLLGVEPPNGWIYDSSPYCSYFDNVRLVNEQFSTLETACLDLFGRPCDELSNEQVQQAQNSICQPPQQCIGNDLYINTVTENGQCVSRIISNYQTCVTQNFQNQTFGSQSIFVPISSIANQIVNTTTNQTLAQAWQAAGLGGFLVFLTPIFWIMVIVAIFSIVAAAATKHMEIGIFVGALILVAFAAALPELVWITIVLVVLSGIFLGRSFVKWVGGS